MHSLMTNCKLCGEEFTNENKVYQITRLKVIDVEYKPGKGLGGTTIGYPYICGKCITNPKMNPKMLEIVNEQFNKPDPFD